MNKENNILPQLPVFTNDTLSSKADKNNVIREYIRQMNKLKRKKIKQENKDEIDELINQAAKEMRV